MKSISAALGVVAIAVAAASAQASDERAGVMSQHPSPSPSGTEVVFAADFDGGDRLWVSGLDGSNVRKIVPITNGVPSLAEGEPAWSPDGQQIAYAAMSGTTTDIWVMRPDGAYATRLTSNGANNSAPAWSPDSSRIVFVSDKDGTKDLWIMNRDGTGLAKLLGSTAQENSPSFSPAGDRIVFSRTDGTTASLMTVNVNGSGLATVTSGAFQDWSPSWGPAGIVFTSNRDGSKRWKIWRVQADGSGLTQIGNVPGQDPVWARDGRVLFIDEAATSKASAAVSVLTPATGAKQVVADVQGYSAAIAIRPKRTVNRVNPASMGRIRVAVLSTATFDAFASVAQQSLTFGRTGSESSLFACAKKSRDVNGDGIPDLVCRFTIRSAGFQQGNTSATLRFADAQGKPYEGRDAIVTSGGDDPEDFTDD